MDELVLKFAINLLLLLLYLKLLAANILLLFHLVFLLHALEHNLLVVVLCFELLFNLAELVHQRLKLGDPIVMM